MSITIVRLRTLMSPANLGWMSRLYALDKGYRVTSSKVGFGRAEHIIRRGGVALTLTQGNETAVKCCLKDLTAEESAILEDLEGIGMLAR